MGLEEVLALKAKNITLQFDENLSKYPIGIPRAKQVGVRRLAMESRNCKVCVTGGTGYVGSLLVKRLLEKGYTAPATTRNLSDASKVGFSKSLPYADTRLVLFQAEIYNPDDFDHAIKGCETVFHLVTPKRHIENSQFKNITEAALAAAKSIATSCIQSALNNREALGLHTPNKSSLRVVLTSSGGSSKKCNPAFKDFVDETCWTPPNLSFPFPDDNYKDHVNSKTSVEKEILSYDGKLDVVTLTCGLPGGETILNRAPGNMWVYISQLTDWKKLIMPRSLWRIFLELSQLYMLMMHAKLIYSGWRILQFRGRFFCASGYISTADFANYFQKNHPEYQVKQGYLDGPNREVNWDFTKLIKKGFEYKYDNKTILDERIRCARRMGGLPQRLVSPVPLA